MSEAHGRHELRVGFRLFERDRRDRERRLEILKPRAFESRFSVAHVFKVTGLSP